MNSLFNAFGGWQQSVEVQRLSSVLLHFVWQGAAVALVAWCVLKAMSRATAATRYAVLLGLFGLLTALPIATYWLVDIPQAFAPVMAMSNSDPASSEAPLVSSTIQGITEPASPPVVLQLHVMPPALRTSVEAGVEPVTQRPGSEPAVESRSLSDRGAEWIRRNRPLLIALWFAGVILQSLRLLIGFVGLEAARRRGTIPAGAEAEAAVSKLANRLGLKRAVRVLESRLADSPMIAGWLKPVILLPATAATGLTASQLEAILAHELAHIRRHDALVNLLQTVVETLLFFHPTVWWLSRKIRDEREHCCDDVAVSICGDRVALARALCAMAELRPVPRWALAARGGSLIQRVRRLIGRPEELPASHWPAATVAMTAVLVAWGAMQTKPEALVEDKPAEKPAVTPQLASTEGSRLSLPPGPIAMDAVVARVDGEPILAGDVLGEFETQLDKADRRMSPQELRETQEALLRRRLPDELQEALFAKAVVSKLSPSQLTKVNEQLAKMFEQYVSSQGKELESRCKEAGRTIDDLRKQFSRRALSSQYLQTRLGDEQEKRDAQMPAILNELRERFAVATVFDTEPAPKNAATSGEEVSKTAVSRLTLPPGPIAMDAIVARVNGELVAARFALLELKGELDETTRTLSLDELRKRQEELLRERMSSLVDQELFVQAIKTRMTKAQWEKVSEQLDKQMSKTAEEGGRDFGDEIAMEAKQLGISVEEARRMIAQSLLAQQYLDAKIGAIDVTGDELKAAYRDRPDEFQNPPHARWRQFQFKFGDDREAARRKAEMAAALANGGMSFESITKKLTGVVYSEQEGDPNWSPAGGRLAAELQRPLSELKPGGVSDAVEGADCYWVIQLVERTEAALPPYEKVENRIRLKLVEEKRAAKERAIGEELRAKFPVVTVFDESPVDESQIVRQPDEVASASVPVVPAGDQTPQQSGIPKGTEKVIANIQVLTADGKPATGAKVRPTSYGTIAGSSFGLTEDWFPSAVTDETGRATLKCLNADILAEFSGETGAGRLMRMFEFPVGNDEAAGTLYLEIDHPGSPIVHKDVPAQSKEATITLAKASTIRVKAKRAEDGRPVSRLAPSFGGPWGTKPDWSEADGVLTIRRLDLKSQQAPRWLTLVHVPETGPAMFSDPIDLKRFADEDEIDLTVAMREGTRVEGELDRKIPRPVRNGRVVGQIVFGIPEKGTWTWGVAADVNEDGKFVLESVPPDLTLQVMAYCDGWISRSADVEQLREFKARSGFWASEAGMEQDFSVRPQLHHVSNRTMRLTMSMEPTADCEVTVVDDKDQPVAGASVAFQPNVAWFNFGSSLIGPGADALDWWRKRLAEGHDPVPETPPMTRFSAFTDAQGMASIRNLPAGVNQIFMVASPGLTVRDELPEYASIGLPGGFQKTVLTAGEVTRVKVPMTKDLGPLILASPDEPPVQ